MKQKIAYITGQAPLTNEEPYITEEMLSLKKQNIPLIIFPRDIYKESSDNDGKSLLKETVSIQFFNLKILSEFLRFVVIYPKKTLNLIYKIAFKARNPIIAAKNLFIFPKAVYISKILNKETSHIHAHWGSTTATMGYIINNITNIPWSFTLHRWDIPVDNILGEKAKTASFIRATSNYWAKEIKKLINPKDSRKIKTIYMGLEIPKIKYKKEPKKENLVIAVPARLTLEKGHVYIIKAASLLLKKGISSFTMNFYGKGYLKNKLEKLISKGKLENKILFHGNILHDKLLKKYGDKEIQVVVLPSLSEGLPNALIEAMSYGIPVISTNNTGTPELVARNGLLVPPKNPNELAKAIEKLIKNKNLRTLLGKKGRNKVIKDFNQNKTSAELIRLFKKYSKKMKI